MRTFARRINGVGAALLIGLAALPGSAFAFESDEVLKDPALEARARSISAELRCPVCQNQSIDDSNAPLSKDLRLLVRERLVAGDNDAAVKQFIVARYGEFVLLKPPLGAATIVLWIAPLLLLGIVALVLFRRAHVASSTVGATPGDAPLTEGERARLRQMLGEDARIPKV